MVATNSEDVDIQTPDKKIKKIFAIEEKKGSKTVFLKLRSHFRSYCNHTSIHGFQYFEQHRTKIESFSTSTEKMSSEEVKSDVSEEDEAVSHQFSSTRKLYLGLACWIGGTYTIDGIARLLYYFWMHLETLIIIIVITIIQTIPLTFTVLGMSQYSRRGPIKIWDAAPGLRGIAISGILCLLISILEDITLTSYFLFYLIQTRNLPWLKCPQQEFGKRGCFTFRENSSIQLDCIEAFNEEHCNTIPWQNSAATFFEDTANMDMTKPYLDFQPHMIPYQMAIIIILFICIRKSERSFEIFVNFLVFFPTILHGILFVRSFLHPGTFTALEFMSRFNVAKFSNSKAWLTMIIFNFGNIGYNYGGLSVFAKQLHFRSPTNAVAIFMNVTSVTYYILYGVFLYNMEGILCYELNMPMEPITEISQDQNFIQIPLGFAYWNFTKFWTFLFYLANFFTSFRHLAIQNIVLLNIVYETIPKLSQYTIYCSLVYCIIMACLMVISNFNIVHWMIKGCQLFSILLAFPVLTLYCSIFLVFVYGVGRFVDDMHFMLGFRPVTLWKLSWYLGVPLYVWATYYSFIIFIELDMAFVNVSFIIVIDSIPLIYLVVKLVINWRKKGTIIEVFRPLKTWGPHEEILRKSRDMFSAHAMTKEYLYRQQRLTFRPTQN